METHVLLIATSLDPHSRSQALAAEALAELARRNVGATLLDLREMALPLYGSESPSGKDDIARLHEEVTRATHLLFAVPIYNFDVNAGAKNVMEFLMTDHLENKAVGFLCAAGGQASYMSVLPFANSLMLDFRCWIVPRFVYATGKDFQDNRLHSADVLKRIAGLIDDLLGWGRLT